MCNVCSSVRARQASCARTAAVSANNFTVARTLAVKFSTTNYTVSPLELCAKDSRIANRHVKTGMNNAQDPHGLNGDQAQFRSVYMYFHMYVCKCL